MRLPVACLFALSLSAPLSVAQAADPFAVLPPMPECSAAADLSALTLGDVARIALCRNPQARETLAAIRVQAAAQGVAQAAYLPSLSANLSAGRSVAAGRSNDTAAASLSLSWLLLDFGARRAQLEQAKALLAAVGASGESTTQGLLLAAVQSFQQLQSAQALRRSTQMAEQAAASTLAAARLRYQLGAVTPADSLQSETALAQAQLARIRAEGDEKIALGNLAALLGLAATTPLALAPQPLPQPPEDFGTQIEPLIALAEERRPDLRAAAAELKAAEAALAATAVADRPTLALSAQAGEQRPRGGPVSRTQSASLNLTLPIFDGFAPTYRIAQAEAQRDAKAERLARIEQQVALDVWSQYQNLRTASQSLHTANRLVVSSRAAEAMARGRYEAGVGSLLDLLNAQSALASAEQQQIQFAYGWSSARAALAQAVGALDAALLQSLPIAASIPSVGEKP